jgi:hypothetical protein
VTPSPYPDLSGRDDQEKMRKLESYLRQMADLINRLLLEIT